MNRKIIFKGKRIAALILVVAMIIASVCAYAVYDKKSQASQDNRKMEQIKEALNKKRSESMSKMSNISIDDVDENKEIKYIIELKGKAAVDMLEDVNCITEINKVEKQVLNNQASAISRIQSITGNKVKAQLGYLVNAIVINAKVKDIYKICKLTEVKEVYKSEEYDLEDIDSILNYTINDYKLIEQGIDSVTGLKDIRDNVETNYSGIGTLVAVIDTGVNYEHQDMKLDPGVVPKYTKEEWKEKIKILGYGKYFSEKVPFGYNYIDKDNNIKGKEELHGNHVAGIVCENGELKGSAPNTQIVGLKVVGEKTGNTEQIIKAMEDATKLDVDVINMSLGSNSEISVVDNIMSKVIKKSSEQGIVCCISAGNTATIDKSGNATNKFNITDTSTISSPGNIGDTLTVASAKVSLENGVVKKEMSNFSAWGPTNDLTIKPEIAAPGENILALYNESKGYDTLSGTSMATPFISGCVTLLVNDVQKKNIKSIDGDQLLKGKELHSYIKNNLLNTAEVIYDVTNYGINDKVPYSIRLQGAGLVNVNSAVNNKVLATYNGEAKLEVGEIVGSKNVKVILTNYGDTDVTYKVETSDVYAPYNKDNGNSYCMINSGGASITSGSEEVTVPARGKASVQLTISASSLENTFIEGYVRFRGDGVPTLSMPMLGFAGNWYVEPIVDKSVYDIGLSYLEQKQVKNPNTNESLKSKTCLVGNNAKCTDNVLGIVSGDGRGNNIYNGQLNAFSPNGDGIMDEVYPGITQLRNIYEVKINITDQHRKKLRVLGVANNIPRKDLRTLSNNLLDTLSNYKALSYVDTMKWDGTLYDNITGNYSKAADGVYYMQLELKASNDTRATFINMPIRIDTEKPQISERKLDSIGNNYTYTFSVKDNIGLEENIYVYNNGVVTEHRYLDGRGNQQGSGTIDLGDIQGNEVYIMFTDVAGNQSIDKVSLIDGSSNVESCN